MAEMVVIFSATSAAALTSIRAETGHELGFSLMAIGTEQLLRCYRQFSGECAMFDRLAMAYLIGAAYSAGVMIWAITALI